MEIDHAVNNGRDGKDFVIFWAFGAADVEVIFLSKNTGLRWDEVRNILRRSAGNIDA